MTRALAEIRGLDLPILRGLQPDTPETARDAVYVARARRGDRDVKPELMRIAREAPVPLLRVEAVMSFMFIGTVQDFNSSMKSQGQILLMCLGRAKSLSTQACPRLPERKHPVRIAANEVMANIFTRTYHPLPR